MTTIRQILFVAALVGVMNSASAAVPQPRGDNFYAVAGGLSLSPENGTPYSSVDDDAHQTRSGGPAGGLPDRN